MDDKLKGSVEEAQGRVKEGVGRATDDPKLESEGTWDRAKGEVDQKIGEVKERDRREDLTRSHERHTSRVPERGPALLLLRPPRYSSAPNSKIGRTSTEPDRAPGMRAAHSMA